MRLLAPIAFLVAALLIALSADHPRARADFVLVQRADATTLDPQRMSWQQDFRIGRALYEGLATLDAQGTTPQPGVAESWDISGDRLTYTFHLRANARWSNGEPVTAEDFVYAWRRGILPETAADYSGFLFHIRGAEEFFDWRNERLTQYASQPASERTANSCATLWRETLERFRATVGVRATDARTLVVELKHPVAYFLDLVAFPSLSPVHRASVEACVSFDPSTGRLVQQHGWTKSGQLISNGPYRMVDWRYRRDMFLERNEHYWNAAEVRSRTVEVRIVEDANTTVLSAEAGACDWVTDTLAEYRPEMLAERLRYETRYAADIDALVAKGMRIDDAVATLPEPEPGERRNAHGLRSFGTDFYSFNCRPSLTNGKPNPFSKAGVRRAFALAVDRPMLVERVTRLNEEPSAVLVPRDAIPGYESPKGLPFDPARARKELAEAGWSDRNGDGLVEDENGERFPTVDLVYSLGSPRYRDLSFALREMWRSALGVEVQARAKDVRDFRDDLKTGNFMIARGGWYGDYGDPTTFLDLARSTDGNNDRKYASKRYDGLLDQAAGELDPAKRLAILSEAERIIVEEDLPILPLCGYVTVYMYDPKTVHGLTHHPRLEQYLSRLVRSADAKATSSAGAGDGAKDRVPSAGPEGSRR